MEIEPGKLARNILILLIVLFSFFVVFWEKKSSELKKTDLEQHAKIIENSVWNLDLIGPVEYLKIAARLSRYESIKIFAVKKDEPFIKVNGPVPDRFKQFLIDTRLILKFKLKTDIFHDNFKIGTLEVVYLNDTIYLYLYLIVILGLIWLSIKFFIIIVDAKQTLEIKVDKRTRDIGRLQNLLSNIINSMPSILVGVDEKGRVSLWNHEAEKVTGVMFTEAKGRLLATVFPRMEKEMGKIEDAIQTRKMKKQVNKKNQVKGKIFYSDMTIYPLLAHNAGGAVIRIDDVTERVRMEEVMVQSEKMMSVGGLAAGMAHEINNPLAGIVQNAIVVQNRLTRKELPINIKTAQEAGTEMEAIYSFMEKRDIFKFLNNIRSSGDRAAKIINNMLSFARKSDKEFSSHRVDTLLDGTLDLARTDYDLKKGFDFKKIKIIREYPEKIPLIICEQNKIQQVFYNIFKNGAEAMHGVQKDPEFILRISQKANLAQIEIQDNGPGIEEEVRKRIFEPFFTTKSTDKGTGLGLSISYFIVVDDHGGEMAVTSSRGNGANFIIKLPTST